MQTEPWVDLRLDTAADRALFMPTIAVTSQSERVGERNSSDFYRHGLLGGAGVMVSLIITP
jgi:hypothetical protein